MRAMLLVLALSSSALAQFPHVAVYPVHLQSPDGTVVFHGTMGFFGGAPIMLGTLTVNGDNIAVPPQFVQSLPYGLWWRWALPGGHSLSVGSHPGSNLEGHLVTQGTGGSGITNVHLY